MSDSAKNRILRRLDESLAEPAARVLADTFAAPPWLDRCSADAALAYVRRCLADNRCPGYLLEEDGEIVAVCTGFVKPWLDDGAVREEYWIDQFCVRRDMQRQGIGSEFLRRLTEDLSGQGIDALLLTTEFAVAGEFYRKNGFTVPENVVLMVR